MIYSTSILTIFTGEQKCLIKFQENARLAWRLLCYECASLIDYLKQIIFSSEFLQHHKICSNHFIRQRKLPFSTIILILLNFMKGSYQDELDQYFKAISGFDVAKRIVSKAAFTKARLKLGFEAFIELNRQMLSYFHQKFNPMKWHGFNLRAVDGSTVQLPRTEAVADHFGSWHPRQGDKCPMARISQMFDPINKISIHATISPKEIGERELAAGHFLNLLANDLVLLDRGYPAYWLFNLILSLGSNFCARISYKKWDIIRKFYNSAKLDKIIYLKPSLSAIKKCKEKGLNIIPLKLRLIRVELDTGEVEILITSVLDQNLYPTELFKELYHLRWPVEEDYKTMKQWIEIENFSGKSVLSVYQDFHAKVFSKNITRILTHPTLKAIDKKTEACLYRHKTNFTQSISKMKNVLPLLFVRTAGKIIEMISALHTLFIITTEPVRPDRKFARNKNNRSNRFNLNYKRAC